MIKPRPHDGFAEPTLDDLLEDPILDAVLRCDGLSREDLASAIAAARALLSLEGGCAAQAGSSSLSQ